jgi:hypothetical protein
MDDSYLDVNRHGVLRVPGPLWFGFAVLARHWILMLLVAVSARRDPSIVAVLGENGVPWTMLAVQLPVVLVALAGARRQPEAGVLMRALWRGGREIVAATAVLNIGWTAHLLLDSDYWLPWPELFLGSCALIDIAVALSLYTTPYFKQLFREFPERPSEAQRS